MKRLNRLRALNHQLSDHSTDARVLLLVALAAFVGMCGAVSAWALLKLIYVATNLFWYGKFSLQSNPIENSTFALWVITAPALGGLLIGIMARFGSDKIRGHGIPEAIETILFGESRLSFKVALLKPLSSAISIGSGGPFGAEGPIIMTGGAIGSLFAQYFSLSAAERKTLLVAGAASGMTAIFGTPLSAVLLALEVLLFEWKPRSFIPVTIAVMTSLALRPALIGVGPMFPYEGLVQNNLQTLCAAIALGVIVGLESALLSKLLYRIEDAFHHLPFNWMWWPAIGGILVGCGGLNDIRVLGAGYTSIQNLLDNSYDLQSIGLLLAVKAIVWLFALGSGTSGGILAPLLILGGAVGCIAGYFLPGDSGFWAMIGMAGILSGAMRAPLMGTLFAVEVTGSFSALPYSLAAASAAYAVSVLLIKRSILTEKIARRGRHILQEYTVDSFELLQAKQIMTPAPRTLSGRMSIRMALDFFEREAVHRSYPVVDDENRLLGLVSRSDAIRWQAEKGSENSSLNERISHAFYPVAYPSTTVGAVSDLMIQSGIGRVPIVDPLDNSVVGILSRHDLLKTRHMYRENEDRRVRIRQSIS